MKNKTKRIIAIVVAVLFSLTIIGGIILSAIAPKDTVTASADTSEISPYSVTAPSETYALMGCYQFTIPVDNDYLYYDSNPSSTIEVPCNLLIASSLCNGLRLFFRNGGLYQISANFLGSTGTTWTVLFRSGHFGLSDYSYWCFLGDYDEGILRFVKMFGEPCLDEVGYQQMYDYVYDKGYEIGRNDGYLNGENVGYSNGYSDGLNKGHSEQITNPLTSFLEPVHRFMNTPFFGDLTYATIFNIILFVAVATIFIKMFSGG